MESEKGFSILDKKSSDDDSALDFFEKNKNIVIF